jgi:hypothetical protein
MLKALTKSDILDIIDRLINAPIAQLDRATAF